MPKKSAFAKQNLRGFTLIELLIVITIIGILSAIGLVAYSYVMKQGRDSKRQSDLRAIQTALEQYYTDQGFYPTMNGVGGYNGLLNLLYDTSIGPFTNQIGNPNAVANQKKYIDVLPKDPTTTGQSDSYYYNACDSSNTLLCYNTPTSKCVTYCLCAKLENAGSTTTNSCCTQGCTLTSRNFFLTPP